MFIKNIVIDGFKSYAKRTEINGFDPAFNAITGLNGSGKSNILDAICFLLGITNLSQVRANNLQDLVYKGGQAGVLKATVSVVFDNRQKAESPIGYETFDELTITRQIAVGGKNKYLINGITATSTRVHDLFRSVQLNVNNPHFLIMQGRITKVLNMKPQEILSLLEEAAATKLYETKRESTLATIDKKESKLKEINKLLTEEINPKLTKLRQERSSYMEYQNISRELEYLTKFIIACKFTNLKVTVDNAGGLLLRLQGERSKEETVINKCNEDKVCLERSIELLSEKREKHILPNYEKLDTELSELHKAQALLNNAVKHTSEAIVVVKENLKKLEKEKGTETKSSNKIRGKIAKIQSDFDGLKSRMTEDKLRLDKAQQQLQAVNSGLFMDDTGGTTASLSDLLSGALKVESQLEIELKVLNMKIDHSKKAIRDLEMKMDGLSKDNSVGNLEANHRQIKSKIDQLAQGLSKSDYSPDKYNTLYNELIQTKNDIRTNETDRNNVLFNNRLLKFEYTKPTGSFDEKNIHGVVATLIDVLDGSFNIALQTAAGSRLYNIIVEDDEVAAKLFSGNCLKERKTLLPLNKMQGEFVSNQLVRTAEEIVGKNNVWSVVSLIKFDQRYTKAMACVFGRCLVARNLDVAKTIAFDTRIRCKAVTLEGDVFDPEGTLVGGSNNNAFDALDVAKSLKDIERTLDDLKRSKIATEDKMRDVGAEENKWKADSRELDGLQVQLRQMEVRMMQNSYLQVEMTLSETKVERDQLCADLTVKTSLHEAAKKKTAEAQYNLDNSVSVKEKAQRAAQEEVKDSRRQFEKTEVDFNAIEFEYESLTLELKSNEDDSNRVEQDIKEANAELARNETELVKEKEALAVHKKSIVVTEEKVKEQRKCLASLDQEIGKKRGEIKTLMDNKEGAESNLEDANHRIMMHKTDSEAAEERLSKMLKKHVWIYDERANFGIAGSMYDFEANSLRTAEQKVEKLSDQKQKLSRKVDMRGMNMLGHMEERYDEVTSKYRQVLQDKSKLQEVIDDLDKRKDEVLRKAHEQVDQDFDKIFSTLLPGSRARLVPPQGKTLKEGLEFRISFGNVLKESLLELSGGQRSLVALSLILALLRFKPAPLYILDEVDAALDISHTQNIGTIIKEQFSNSQFIIVSLKDGMFNNANVLYKTKFVDGVSTVSRHVNQTRRPMTEKNN